MGDTNLTKHPNFVHIGPASLCLYDEVNDLLVVTGKADDLRLAKEVELAYLTEIINGVEVEVDAQPVKETYKLKGILRETKDPNTQRLMLKNCGTPAVTGTCTIGTVSEKVQMFLGRQHKLKYNNGFYGIGALPAPQSVSGIAVGVGGTVPTDSYTFVVTGVYGGTEGASKSSALVAVVLGEKVEITIVPPAGGASPKPDFYRIYVYDDAEVIADADLIMETDTLTVFFAAWIRGTDFPGEQTSSFTVTDDGGVIEFDAGDDYSIDASCSKFCLVSGGAIGDGTWVNITYTYYKNPFVEMTIGPSTHLPRYVHPVILAFKDDDRDTPVGRGLEIHLWKVVADSSWEWALSKMDFDTGFNFEWSVLISENELNHGYVYTFHRQFSSFALEDFADYTDWTNQIACEVPVS